METCHVLMTYEVPDFCSLGGTPSLTSLAFLVLPQERLLALPWRRVWCAASKMAPAVPIS